MAVCALSLLQLGRYSTVYSSQKREESPDYLYVKKAVQYTAAAFLRREMLRWQCNKIG